MNRCRTVLLLILVESLRASTTVHADDREAHVLAAYATQPQSYPIGEEYARPDRSVPFRWHHYHDGAIECFAEATMLPHVDPYNALEDRGVSTERGSPLKWEFVSKHATAGKHALQVSFPAEAIRAGTAVVQLQATAGGRSFSSYLGNRLPTASAFGPHYRWIKLDAVNPAAADVRVRISGVPFVLHAGRNVIAVKMADAVDRHYQCLFHSIPVQVVGPEGDVTLFLDNVRVEQETPAVLSQRGRLFQFPARAEAKDPPVVAPGFTAVETDTLYSVDRGYGWTAPKTTRSPHGHSFRSNEHGLLWGCCLNIDAPFRVDVPPGRYGICILGAPHGGEFRWSQGLRAKVNEQDSALLDPRSESQVRQLALGGESWNFRPGSSVWESLVRPPYYPAFNVIYADATDGKLLLELPKTLALHALFVFPEADTHAALRELGRLNYLLAESWDVSHPWIKGGYASRSADGHPYIGAHDEMIRPESIPARLRALNLVDADYSRGFVLFERGLAEAVYADTIPEPKEVAFHELRTFASPGERVCLTLGLLPLRESRGLTVTIDDLRAGDKNIPATQVDIRVSRQHQKTMQFGHHNHDYNYEEHYLVRHSAIDLYPAAARRIYFDIPVAAEVPPGKYTAAVHLWSAERKELARVPVEVEVLPIQLVDPPVFFASSHYHPLLKEYGFNTFPIRFDEARQQSHRGYIDFAGALSLKEQRAEIEAGLAGRGPRGFFGGFVNGQPVSKDMAETLLKEIPRLDLFHATLPLYAFKLDWAHEWSRLGPRNLATADTLEAARASGKEFWFIDGLRHSKEQAGRFTHGIWLWRIGARGRFTSLAAALQYGGGTARTTYGWDPYFTLLDVTTCNVDRALMESVTEGQWNPCRDLLLVRAGIDDSRYLHTLETWIRQAESKKPDSPALATAKDFRQKLFDSLYLDLGKYYSGRAGSYGENWSMLPNNPWTTEKLDGTRRETAQCIMALQKAMAQ